jgi:hypothetical protein
MKSKILIYAFLFALIFCPEGAWARYTDEIAVSRDEVWKAAFEALKPFGLRKADEKKMILETKWIHDTVKRRNKLLLNMPSQEYDRRYRVKVLLKDRAGDTLVEVKGVFQQRYPNHEQKTWETIQPKADDLDLEQEMFMKILNQLSRHRNDSV